MGDGLAGLIENGFRTIDRDASNFFIVGQVRETVAVGEGDAWEAFDDDAPRQHLFGHCSGFACMLRTFKFGELVRLVVLAAVHEIVRLPAVENFLGGGLKREDGVALRRAGEFRAASNDFVELAAVKRRDVFHVSRTLKPSFDFEGGNARIDQSFQIRTLIVVLEREYVLGFGEFGAGFGINIVRQTAELRAFAAVGRPPGKRLTHPALTRIAHAERPMHEEFNAGVLKLGADGGNFRERKFAGEHELREPDGFKKRCFFGRPNVALR